MKWDRRSSCPLTAEPTLPLSAAAFIYSLQKFERYGPFEVDLIEPRCPREREGPSPPFGKLLQVGEDRLPVEAKESPRALPVPLQGLEGNSDGTRVPCLGIPIERV